MNTERETMMIMARGDHVLRQLIDEPLLLIDLIPQTGQLLVIEAPVRLPLLADGPLGDTATRLLG